MSSSRARGLRVLCHTCNSRTPLEHGQTPDPTSPVRCPVCNSDFCELESVPQRRSGGGQRHTGQPIYTLGTVQVSLGGPMGPWVGADGGGWPIGAMSAFMPFLGPGAGDPSDPGEANLLNQLFNMYSPPAHPTAQVVLDSLPRLKVQPTSRPSTSGNGPAASSGSSSTTAFTSAAPAGYANCHAGEQCSVCHDLFVPEEQVVELPCSHCFHEPCVLPWLREHNTCPMCRHKLPDHDEVFGPAASTTRASASARSAYRPFSHTPSPGMPGPAPPGVRTHTPSGRTERLVSSAPNTVAPGTPEAAAAAARDTASAFQPGHSHNTDAAQVQADGATGEAARADSSESDEGSDESDDSQENWYARRSAQLRRSRGAAAREGPRLPMRVSERSRVATELPRYIMPEFALRNNRRRATASTDTASDSDADTGSRSSHSSASIMAALNAATAASFNARAGAAAGMGGAAGGWGFDWVSTAMLDALTQQAPGRGANPPAGAAAGAAAGGAATTARAGTGAAAAAHRGAAPGANAAFPAPPMGDPATMWNMTMWTSSPQVSVVLTSTPGQPHYADEVLIDPWTPAESYANDFGIDYPGPTSVPLYTITSGREMVYNRPATAAYPVVLTSRPGPARSIPAPVYEPGRSRVDSALSAFTAYVASAGAAPMQQPDMPGAESSRRPGSARAAGTAAGAGTAPVSAAAAGMTTGGSGAGAGAGAVARPAGGAGGAGRGAAAQPPVSAQAAASSDQSRAAERVASTPQPAAAAARRLTATEGTTAGSGVAAGTAGGGGRATGSALVRGFLSGSPRRTGSDPTDASRTSGAGDDGQGAAASARQQAGSRAATSNPARTSSRAAAGNTPPGVPSINMASFARDAVGNMMLAFEIPLSADAAHSYAAPGHAATAGMGGPPAELQAAVSDLLSTLMAGPPGGAHAGTGAQLTVSTTLVGPTAPQADALAEAPVTTAARQAGTARSSQQPTPAVAPATTPSAAAASSQPVTSASTVNAAAPAAAGGGSSSQTPRDSASAPDTPPAESIDSSARPAQADAEAAQRSNQGKRPRVPSATNLDTSSLPASPAATAVAPVPAASPVASPPTPKDRRRVRVAAARGVQRPPATAPQTHQQQPATHAAAATAHTGTAATRPQRQPSISNIVTGPMRWLVGGLVGAVRGGGRATRPRLDDADSQEPSGSEA